MSHDAIVIGANLAGLAAAAYLADAGKRVLLLEAEAAPREPIGPLADLDPQMVAELKLIRRGLRFSARDLGIVQLGDVPLRLGRDSHEAARALAAVSDADAKAWPAFRRALFDQARRLRRFWWSALKEGAPHWVLNDRASKEAFDRLCLTGAQPWLAAHFESDAAIAALLWDGVAGGLAPSEPGSALMLLWRAAGEMAGLQGASALPVPGTLLASLRTAAAGATLRTDARAKRILTASGRVEGVELEDSEVFIAPIVLSALPQAATARLLGRTSPASYVGEAQLQLTLSEPVTLPPARYRLVETPEDFIGAHEAARAGRLPSPQPMEFVPVDSHRLAVTLQPFPATPPAGWRARAAAQAIFAIGRHVPGLARGVSNVEFRLSAPRDRLEQMLAPAGARVLSGTEGLYLCGPEAEPVASISGRAARVAAGFALKA